ncbi:hypothetical protein PCASD_17639 [Puccinia coronata f. sp. avenae]|uniref:Uncharacterized protein n=1 Tax=Puccinia coronata f. sp. avenae TaxID=200324 RepID=A0A2N5TU11_9BASI|nr:hypothetical protein PCASD_17639 [Puccinia coronata f. sp. avenae]
MEWTEPMLFPQSLRLSQSGFPQLYQPVREPFPRTLWAATTALPGTWHTVAPSGLQKAAVVPATEEAWCALG